MPNVWYGSALALRMAGRYNESIKAYNKTLEMEPGNAAAWNGEALALEGMKDYNASLRLLDRAIEIDPNEAGYWNNKGMALKETGNYSESVASLRESGRARSGMRKMLEQFGTLSGQTGEVRPGNKCL